MDTEQKKQRIDELRAELAELEAQLEPAPKTWIPAETGYYGMYHATSGLTLGMIAAIASLLFNVVGSLAVGKHPLEIIKVYLTFGLGEQALSPDFDTGIALAIGCCLYIGTGALLGVVLQMAFARFTPNATLTTRLMFATLLGLVIWGVNFYLLIEWLQQRLFGGTWIVDPQYLPPWVAAATHLVFAWTMAILYPWGRFEPYQRQTRKLSST